MRTPSNMIHVDTGADSDVYRFKHSDIVVKVYSGLREGLLRPTDLDRCKELIDRYLSDTLKAKEIMDSEWSNAPESVRKMWLNNVTYTLTPKVLPQGERKVMFSEVVLIGQEYIPGLNLQQIAQGYSVNAGLHSSMNSRQEKLGQIVQHVTTLINKKMNIPFNIALKNVKPVVNESTQTIDMVITDLAGGIGEIYAPIFGYPYHPVL